MINRFWHYTVLLVLFAIPCVFAIILQIIAACAVGAVFGVLAGAVFGVLADRWRIRRLRLLTRMVKVMIDGLTTRDVQ
jgi:hypothetical protein